ncbi:MAG: acylneuraminate cytidylyltransferase family protein [Methanobrevibacter sp.]|nr:acylneuraminate cytidylyltransferase family protein [Methanobrevibacter sp.]
MNICSIITARGGSKGIPRKNIKNLNGKPVIAYSIEPSVTSDLIKKTYVTTEDAEISKISKEFNAEVINRPQELAEDTSTSVDVILHALNYLEKKDEIPDVFVLLQPTSPLRTTEDINNAINLFIENECDALISVCEIDHTSMLSMALKNKFLVPNCDEKFLNKRRQDLPTYYSPNGAIYITTPKILKEKKTFIPKRTIPYVMPKERSIDLDTPFDFKLAEFFLKKINS